MKIIQLMESSGYNVVYADSNSDDGYFLEPIIGYALIEDEEGDMFYTRARAWKGEVIPANNQRVVPMINSKFGVQLDCELDANFIGVLPVGKNLSYNGFEHKIDGYNKKEKA